MDETPPSRMDRWRGRWQQIRKLVRSMAPFASGVLAALFALLLYNGLVPGPHVLTEDEVSDRVAEAMASATPRPPYAETVYQIIQPSLVLIESTFPEENDKPHSGLGSGVVVTNAGEILTSLHVVANATEIRLTFADGSQTGAEVVAAQPENDIAVLAPTEMPGLIAPAVLGNPRAMNIGDEAFAVGNPFGLYGSMSAGVISGFERSFKLPGSEQRISGLIQFDAAVNPGNSGGPLLNRRGQVVGIVTAILNPTEDDVFIGIGFAVPITAAGGGIGLPPY